MAAVHVSPKFVNKKRVGRGNLNQWENPVNIRSSNQIQLSVWSVSDSVDWYTCVLSDFIKNAWWNRHWLRRFVDGTWYNDRTNGHALAQVYLYYNSVLKRYLMLQCGIHVYSRVVFSLAGTCRQCMTYISNPSFLISWACPCGSTFWPAMLKFVLWLRMYTMLGLISQPRDCNRYKTLHINTIM